MKTSKFSEAQIAFILRQAEEGAVACTTRRSATNGPVEAPFWNFEALAPPDPRYPLVIHPPALGVHQRRDPAIAITSVAGGEVDDRRGQRVLVVQPAPARGPYRFSEAAPRCRASDRPLPASAARSPDANHFGHVL